MSKAKPWKFSDKNQINRETFLPRNFRRYGIRCVGTYDTQVNLTKEMQEQVEATQNIKIE